MLSGEFFLCHWTNKDFVPSISQKGLLPELASGKEPRIWLCHWAIAKRMRLHVAMIHDWDVDKVVPIKVDIINMSLQKTRWDGVFVTPTYVHTSRLDIYHASEAIWKNVKEEWAEVDVGCPSFYL